MSKFIIIEGPDNTGKDTQVREIMKNFPDDVFHMFHYFNLPFKKDLKKHIKGKSSIEGMDEGATEELKVKKLHEDLKKDNQLQQAVSLLSGWEVMKKMFKNY